MKSKIQAKAWAIRHGDKLAEIIFADPYLEEREGRAPALFWRWTAEAANALRVAKKAYAKARRQRVIITVEDAS